MVVNERMLRNAQANLITIQAARIAELEAVVEVQAKRIRELTEAAKKAAATDTKASC